MTASDQRINDLLFMRESLLAQIRQAIDPARVWKLYLLKRELDEELLRLAY